MSYTRLADRFTAVYRMYDYAGDLLYVGMTCDPWARVQEHRETKAWFMEVADIDIEWFYWRELAEDAEKVAIWEERPRYNIVRILPRNPNMGKRRYEMASLGESLEGVVEEWDAM